MKQDIDYVFSIFEASTPVLQIHELTDTYWKRNTANGRKGNKDSRIGPWREGKYSVLNQAAWDERGACLYMVQEGSNIRYIGKSKTRLKDRWRLSPALDPKTMERMPGRQVFHNQCWPYIEQSATQNPNLEIEVRSIRAHKLKDVLIALGEPLSELTDFADDEGNFVAAVERWILGRSSNELANWNTALTNKEDY
ncbi:MAG: hypothetical protein Q4G54_09040 [Pelistega sp.]|nr:hypothetical protein [Pelistega sp.]